MSLVRRLIPLVVIATPALLSCSSTPVTVTARNPRVIERTLVKRPAAYPAPAVPVLPAPAEAADTQPLALSPAVLSTETPTPAASAASAAPPVPEGVYFVEFGNESVVLDDGVLPVEAIKVAMGQSAHAFAVGLSHGPSAVGTHRLAVERARVVAQTLIGAQLDATRIHTLASWGATKNDLAPSRGVTVFVVKEDSPLWHAFLALPTSGRVAQETH